MPACEDNSGDSDGGSRYRQSARTETQEEMIFEARVFGLEKRGTEAV